MTNKIMKIAAIGLAALEIEFACLSTLSKFVREGHEVHIVVARDIGSTAGTSNNFDWTNDEARDFFRKFGLKNMWFMDKLDYSTVTQENASAINSHIKRIKPDMVIMPFWKSVNQIQRILSRTALIACRGVGSILMYELDQNPVFTPTVSFLVSASELASKVSPTAVDQRAKVMSGGQSTTAMFQTLENIAGGTNTIGNNNAGNKDGVGNNNNSDDGRGGGNTATESFESHRMLLAEDTWL